MTGISIGKYISNRIANSPELASLIQDKFFPLATLTSIDFPFVSFKRSSVTPDYTNDGLSGDSVVVEFVVASNKYFQSVEVSEALRAAFEGKRNSDFGITDTKISGASEDFIENTFIQQLTFVFKIE